jgi:hypothetical protein
MRHAITIVLISLLLLSGCARYQTERGKLIDESSIVLEEGETRREDILRNLGPPDQICALPGGCAFLYEYFNALEKQLGLSIGWKWLSLFKFAYGWAGADRQALFLIFDNDEILRSSEYRAWEEDLGSGFSIAFIYSLVSLVDMSHLEEESAAHGWGTGLLRPPSLTPDEQRKLEEEAKGIHLWGTSDISGGERD